MNPVVIDWYPFDEGGNPRIVELNGSIFCVHGRITQKEQLEIINMNKKPWQQTIYNGYIGYEPIDY